MHGAVGQRAKGHVDFVDRVCRSDIVPRPKPPNPESEVPGIFTNGHPRRRIGFLGRTRFSRIAVGLFDNNITGHETGKCLFCSTARRSGCFLTSARKTSSAFPESSWPSVESSISGSDILSSQAAGLLSHSHWRPCAGRLGAPGLTSLLPRKSWRFFLDSCRKTGGPFDY